MPKIRVGLPTYRFRERNVRNQATFDGEKNSPNTFDGSHTIVASETDTAGNIGSASLSFTLDRAAPTVTEILVSDTGFSATDHITSNSALTGTGDPNTTVTLREGTTVLGTTTANASGVWSFTPSTLTDGAHTIVASETDLAGNTGTASLGFTLDRTAPSVKENLVSDTGSSSTDHLTSNSSLTGTGDANAVVTFKEGSTVIGTTTAGANGGWTFTPSLSDGAHVVTASETDAAGNTGTASLSFTIDTQAPVPIIANEVLSSNGKVTLSGMSEAGTSITIIENGSSIGTATTLSNGTWSFTTSGKIADIVHLFTVNATDAAGNVGHSSDDAILGTSGADANLAGSAGVDIILGNTGNDRIIGGGGGDTLTGNAGADTFVYNALTDSQPGPGRFDTITDFTHNSDKIDFSAIFAITGNATLVSTAGTVAANGISYYQSGADTIVIADATTTANHVDMEIHLTGVSARKSRACSLPVTMNA